MPMTVTSSTSLYRRFTRLLPIKPAAPVTNIVLPLNSTLLILRNSYLISLCKAVVIILDDAHSAESAIFILSFNVFITSRTGLSEIAYVHFSWFSAPKMFISSFKSHHTGPKSLTHPRKTIN